MSDATYQHYGWPVSPYSAKTRAYLAFKRIPHVDRYPNLFQLLVQIRRAVGKPIMPTVRTPDGDWWQDTSEIIDRFEAIYPEPNIAPAGPKQRLTSYLLELLADEWLKMPALYYRWTIPENSRFAIAEFGKYGLPWAPGPLQRRAAKTLAQQMQSYLPVLGLTGSTAEGVEACTTSIIAALERHFSTHDFVLGARPCLGDFSLLGPLWAHLYRDPGSRYLFDAAPHVVAWMERMHAPPGSEGDYLDDDAVPETLQPLFDIIWQEQWPLIQTVVGLVADYAEQHPDAERPPRAFGTVPFRIGGSDGQRRAITFIQWMAQRPLDVYAGFIPDERARVDGWLDEIGGAALRSTKIEHRLVRKNFREVFA